jgi:hypothetical protein
MKIVIYQKNGERVEITDVALVEFERETPIAIRSRYDHYHEHTSVELKLGQAHQTIEVHDEALPYPHPPVAFA